MHKAAGVRFLEVTLTAASGASSNIQEQQREQARTTLRITCAILAVLVQFIAIPSLAKELSAKITSPPTIVFDWNTQRCSDDDIPDNPMRAVHLADGTVLGLASHFETRRFLGSNLNAIKRDCVVVHNSHESADPAQFADRTWLSSAWTADGKIIFALGHNEYQADKHPGQCKFPTYPACWYNTVGLFRSTDSGRTFQRISIKPIAAPAFRQDSDQGRPRGFFGPTNIIDKDGYHYALIRTTGGGVQSRGECLFRAENVGDIASWSYFDGQDFVPSALDPYRDNTEQVRPCAKLNGLIGSVTSLVRHKNTGLFVALMGFEGAGNRPAGVYYSTSADLMTWHDPQLLLPVADPKNCDEPFRLGYASLLDPDSPSKNFDSISDDPYLYLTRTHMMKCHMTLNRDLIRMRVHFF